MQTAALVVLLAAVHNSSASVGMGLLHAILCVALLNPPTPCYQSETVVQATTATVLGAHTCSLPTWVSAVHVTAAADKPHN